MAKVVNIKKRAREQERRIRIVSLALSGDITIAELARREDMDRSTIYDWIRKARFEGWELGPAKAAPERAELGLVSEDTISSIEQAPGPISFDALSDDARSALEDFGKFRLDYLGRRSAPWAVEAAHTLLDL